MEEEVEYWAEHAEHQPVFDEAAAKQGKKKVAIRDRGNCDDDSHSIFRFNF